MTGFGRGAAGTIEPPVLGPLAAVRQLVLLTHSAVGERQLSGTEIAKAVPPRSSQCAHSMAPSDLGVLVPLQDATRRLRIRVRVRVPATKAR